MELANMLMRSLFRKTWCYQIASLFALQLVFLLYLLQDRLEWVSKGSRDKNIKWKIGTPAAGFSAAPMVQQQSVTCKISHTWKFRLFSSLLYVSSLCFCTRTAATTKTLAARRSFRHMHLRSCKKLTLPLQHHQQWETCRQWGWHCWWGLSHLL